MWRFILTDLGLREQDDLTMLTDLALRQLDDLAAGLSIAKGREEVARKERIEIEEQIADLVPTKERGQQTIALPSGWKLTVKRDLSYKANVEAIRQLCVYPDLPPPIKSKTTHELDVTGYEWYRERRPDVFDKLAQHVEVKPKKVAITLKAAR